MLTYDFNLDMETTMAEQVYFGLEDNIFGMELIRDAFNSYALRATIKINDIQSSVYAIPMDTEIKSVLAGGVLEHYTYRLLDNVFIWVSTDSDNLRFAFDVQAAKSEHATAAENYIGCDDNSVPGTGDWFSDAALCIPRKTLAAVLGDHATAQSEGAKK
ncbi:hypothetical protein CCAX7_60380 [Capsulimonas corticalis]|uniref:Uncharacterized protein n=1 Tax=Capsulimonas corticalis TaxID=2219043 RepID=A0A402CVZ9_9BACT|nr:hypothetical protein [Capsulimonas corticalis]BDI33987.1 hypothetical protein CCAX7_60380 [Capsulimonas corticalis]